MKLCMWAQVIKKCVIGKIENTCSLRPGVCRGRGRGRSVAYNRPVCQSAMRLRKKTLEPYEIAQ